MSFGPVADTYDRARAGYADAALDWLLPAGRPRVLDLAAGTGKLTAGLVERGCDVIAIDASEQMLAVLRRNLPGVDAQVGSAEATGRPDDDVDVVVIGSALHWFRRPAADYEVARVLRPGGVSGIFRNRRDRTVPWVAALEVMLAERTDMIRVQRSEARRTPLALDRFGPPEVAEFPFVQVLDADRLAQLYASRSYVIDLSERDRDRLLADIRAFGRTHPELAGRSEFELPYRTVVTRQGLLRS